MSMTLDNFGDYLDQAEQRIMNLTPVLTEIGNTMTAQLRQAAPEARQNGGDLKRSISLTVQPQSFGVTMLDYGAYQNYGVRGTKNDTDQKEVEEGLPGAGRKYQFTHLTIGGDLPFGVRKSIAERGLNAKNWFSVADLTEEVTERLGQAITEFFE